MNKQQGLCLSLSLALILSAAPTRRAWMPAASAAPLPARADIDCSLPAPLRAEALQGEPLSSDTLCFEDLFDSPAKLATDWLIEDAPQSRDGPSDWHIADGRLIQSGRIYQHDEARGADEGTSALTRRGPWYDYRVRVEIKPQEEAGVGVIFRYQDADNYYRLFSVKAPARGGPFTRLELKREGRFQTLAQDALSLHEAAADGFVHVRLTAHETRFQVEVNGQFRFEASDGSFSSGRAGLTTSGGAAEFARFRVQLLR